MKYKCVVVDDEPMARNFLQKYCEKQGTLEVLASFPDAEKAAEFLSENEIDILFLDVEMPGNSGFQMLDQMSYMPKVILTTSKTDYAFDAFQYNVADYLKKPITYGRFQESINKVTASLVANPVVKKDKEDIFIKSDGKFTRLNLEEILYIESMGDYVKYFTRGKNYLTLSTLKSIEEKMNSKVFMKVHRSYIVNLRKIKDIQDYSLVIEDKVIPISKNLKSEVMDRINVV
jgi:DNA-binding LytR/AlgR family response regulator